MIRALSQRQRGVAAGALIALLMMVLVGRWGVSKWQEMRQWQTLAVTAASVQKGAVLSLEVLRQSAHSRGISLVDVVPLDGGWQLRGQVANAALLQGWLQSLQADGARPVHWGLEQGASGLSFAVQVRP